ncbi:MAG: phytanoyl-CoA dioxygenase family protein [Myxococcota bacterium]
MLGRAAAKASTVRPETPETPQRPVRAAEIEDYRRDGVVCLRQVVPPHWMDKIRAGVSRAIESPSLFSRMGAAPGSGYNMEIFLWKRDDDLRDVIFGSSLVYLARQLMGADRVHFFYDQLFAKKAGTTTPTPWHHDLTFWPLEGNQICSMWIPTQAVSRQSSGLEFVAGSHRWPNRWKAVGPPNGREDGLLPSASRELVNPLHEDVPPVDELRKKHAVLGWDLEPGDLVAFHPLTLHGSEGNTSATDRAAIAFRFTGDDVTYHPTPYTFPIFFPHGRRVGETMGGPTFPQVLPQTIPEECARRDRRAEIPSPLELARFLARPITRTVREFRQRSLKTANR